MTDLSGEIDRPAPLGERWREPSRVRPKERLFEALDFSRSPWRNAFKAAGRHTARVRVLRWAFAGVSVAAVASVVIVGVFDPFRRLPRNVSIGQVHVDGTRITVESPKITGFQKNGRPYELMARAGFEDTTTPNFVDLLGIVATIGLNDASTMQVKAEHGSYDNLHDHLTLDGSAEIKNEANYSIFMKTAQMDFKTGSLVSRDPVRVVLRSGTVAADQMDIANDGRVSFAGGVKSVIQPGPETEITGHSVATE